MGQKERDENMSATEKKQLRKLVLAQAKEIADLKQYLPKLSHEINLMRDEIYDWNERLDRRITEAIQEVTDDREFLARQKQQEFHDELV